MKAHISYVIDVKKNNMPEEYETIENDLNAHYLDNFFRFGRKHSMEADLSLETEKENDEDPLPTNIRIVKVKTYPQTLKYT